ncbi:hypothetical protein HD806DRAFT_520357 [Xylariaceae sp. AK1471]|nr:hypothetical protein HD806DRAFT_520357 [Xylariaceae sp. AK1471]
MDSLSPWLKISAAKDKERPAYPTQLPPAFWDKLSKLERRKPRRPVTQPNTQCLDYSTPTERGRLKRFARIGGPDLSDLRGSHLGRRKRGSISASENTPTPLTTSTPKTGPYDRAFQHLLIDHGICPDNHEYPNGQVLPPPKNLEEITQAIWQAMSDVIPIIEGKVRDGSYISGQIPFTNLEDPTGGLLVPGNLDRYYGARPEQLDRQVRIQLDKHIVPSTQHDLPIVPNFFLNMDSLQRYSDPEFDADNKAYTLTLTYHEGQLKIYATYPLSRASLGMCREYAMMQINAYALTGNIDAFRSGRIKMKMQM